MVDNYQQALPKNRDLYFNGTWNVPRGGYTETYNPATGESLGRCAEANADDVEEAVQLAHAAFLLWRKTTSQQRSEALREIAYILRSNAEELALIDSANCGNPIAEMIKDAKTAASMLELSAGTAGQVRGETIPMGDTAVNMTIREPFGVCARILAYNHPLMFLGCKIGPAVATGNTVIMKPPPQAPLSAYRFAELTHGILPPGVVNILTCGAQGSAALVSHPLVPRISLVGSVPTGRAIARAGAERLKHVTLELGGKNAFIVFPDADLRKAGQAAVDGMNFTWAGQSCGSTSRLFVHESIYDEMLQAVLARVHHYKPGIPTDPSTTMGSLVSKVQYDKVMSYIAIARDEGAQLLTGGKRPEDARLARGYFVEPTIFTHVTSAMRIAQEEVFGPILSVIKWSDEEQMLADVNSVEYGLTASIWTRDLATAHRVSSHVQADYIWVNEVSRHFVGASFGGYKQSGIGREESFEELLSFTQHKNIHIALNA